MIDRVMNPTGSPRSAGVTKRLLCALLAVAYVAALVIELVTTLRAGQMPTVGQLVDGATGLSGASLFGLYAIKGRG